MQGVWYRGWTVDTATALGLSGWVRNRKDGTVEALVVGAAADVERLIRLAHDGPPAARVERIEVDEALGIVPAGFIEKPTV